MVKKTKNRIFHHRKNKSKTLKNRGKAIKNCSIQWNKVKQTIVNLQATTNLKCPLSKTKNYV